MITRRALLQLLAVAPVAAGSARLLAASGKAWPRKLVLVELQGGNDGLNTVIPVGDPLYAKLRPNLGITGDTIGLGADTRGMKLALAPGLAKLAPILDSGELAVVVGVGYPNPVRSHFRSADIWHTGSGAADTRSEGWAAHLCADVADKQGWPARGLVVAGDAGPLDGNARFAALAADGDKTSKRTERAASNAALAHIARVHDEVRGAHDDVERVVDGALSPRALEGKAFVEQCKVAARALTMLDVGVVKLTLRGFDTHTAEKDQHQRLLTELATGLAELRSQLKSRGAWNDVVIATTSEFGRRARENASGGTDHGTAAPLFVLGGHVKGGVVGVQPRLDDLDGEGDLKFTTDYRAVLAGLAHSAWNVDATAFLGVDALRFT